MPAPSQRKMREPHQTFSCPAGHAQQSVVASDTEAARKDAEKYRKLWQDEQRYAAAVVAERNDVRRKLSAAKGALTRTKKRVANGVCPCCNRTFQNLSRHMQGQHPGYEEGTPS